MSSTVFTDSEGHVIRTSPMKDEHQLIKITEKMPNVQNIGKIVKGDTNSNILTFEINRYYDNVDLYEKNIRFIVKNINGIFTEEAVNLQYNDELLRFSWILSYAVTQKNETVTAAIEFFGTTDSGYDYSLKTLPFTLKIEDSLDATDITVIPPENWFVNIENRLTVLEQGIITDELVEAVANNMAYEDEAIDFSTEFSS